jgi:transposase-like protein
MPQKRTKPGTAKRKTAPLSQKYEAAKEMYESGLSIQEVAKFYGTTRQNMWDILLRRGTKTRPKERTGEANRFYRGGSTASDRAQNLLEVAVRRGIVVRKVVCEKCGATPVMKDGRTGIQAHHPDYNKPLEVMWLCQMCHHEWHKEHRAIPEGRAERKPRQ